MIIIIIRTLKDGNEAAAVTIMTTCWIKQFMQNN